MVSRACGGTKREFFEDYINYYFIVNSHRLAVVISTIMIVNISMTLCETISRHGCCRPWSHVHLRGYACIVHNPHQIPIKMSKMAQDVRNREGNEVGPWTAAMGQRSERQSTTEIT